MPPKPLLSIVVECGTRTITDRIPFRKMAERYLAEARKNFRDTQFELFFVGRNLPALDFGPNCRLLDLPHTDYYGWKNAGYRAARGKYVVFWDSDCRPSPGYLRRVVENFKKNPDAIGVTGRTQYDGKGFLSRLNTVLSFGYCSGVRETLVRYSCLTHNLSLRKGKFPTDPFGDYNGRSGGDIHVTRLAEKLGHPLRFDPNLLIHHEDPSASIPGLMDRHLRDVFQPLIPKPVRSYAAAVAIALPSTFFWGLYRCKLLLKYGKKTGLLNLAEIFLAFPVLAAYVMMDLVAVVGMAFFPRFLKRWMTYQFGTRWMKDQGLA